MHTYCVCIMLLNITHAPQRTYRSQQDIWQCERKTQIVKTIMLFAFFNTKYLLFHRWLAFHFSVSRSAWVYIKSSYGFVRMKWIYIYIYISWAVRIHTVDDYIGIYKWVKLAVSRYLCWCGVQVPANFQINYQWFDSIFPCGSMLNNNTSASMYCTTIFH